MTFRVGRRIPSLRNEVAYGVLKGVLKRQKGRGYEPTFQVLHFTMQDDHLHLIAEATGDKAAEALRTGISGFAISFARSMNKKLGRRGPFWAGRHHRVNLDTRRSVRRTLVYVFQNWKKHGAQVFGDELLDPYSSAFRFKGWSAPHVFFDEDEPFPDAKPRTFLLQKGWRELGGLLHTSEHPTPRPTKRSGRIGVASAPRNRRWRIVDPGEQQT